MSVNKHYRVALALGSNVGDRMVALRKACAALEPYMEITGISPVYQTAAAYVTDQPAFLNAAITATTALEPMALLYTVKDIEREIGRQPTFRYGPRMIDIDIILYDNLQLSVSELTIPHAKLAERRFVLRPLADVAGDWVDPVSGHTMAELLAALPDDGSVQAANEVL